MENPKIRFKGFTKDWEQRKFGELYSKVSEKNDLSFGADKIISVANMYFKEEVKESSDEYMRTYNVMRLGDIAFEGNKSKNYSHGRFVENTIGDGIVSHVFDVFRPTTSYDLLFWKYLINNEGVMGRIMARCTNASTMMTNLVASDFLKEKILVPSLKEQKKIGAYFDSLDHLITLHQRKCEQTKKLKKYMLQKMFPQNGAKVPEIRFYGFTYDWEQRKLKEIADKVSEKNKNNEFSEPFTNSAEQGIISQKDYFDREIVNNENLDSYYIVRNDDFIYNPRISVTAPVGPINRNRLGRNGVMSPLYTVFRTHDIDNLYLEFYFKTTKWHRFMKLNGDSGARFDRFTISSTQFMEMPIPYPMLDEQQKMGEYFDSLDHLITLHQRKCDELKKMKKYMLQNMFI